MFWLKLGFISFGGPAGQIAIMHQELVEKRRWISEGRFLHALNYCMVLPGPEAQQLATYLGWLMHKTWGGIVAGVLFILPSLFILLILSWVYVAWGEFPLIAGLFYGIKPVVCALVMQSLYRIGSRTLKNEWLWMIAILSFAAILGGMSFPLIILLAGWVGYLGGRIAPQAFTAGGGGHGKTVAGGGKAWIDENTPTPSHALFSWARFSVLGIIGLVLCLVPLGLLGFGLGWDHTLSQMAWFFTKAALLTFGGAYAVLPYVYQGAVIDYQWLTPAQMIDGLALGETTPGPLIMVLTFVGFVGAYTRAIFGLEHLLMAGIVAGLLVTWFTFLPSFIFILMGAPLIETTHRQLKFTAPLTAITAAVVGMILNLTVFFIYHVLWQSSGGAGFDSVSALLIIAAVLALLYFKRGVIEVILAGAISGWIIKTSAG